MDTQSKQMCNQNSQNKLHNPKIENLSATQYA